MQKLFEILMLVCFGVSFPVSIYKGITSKSTKGKSLIFVILILMAYIFGTLTKVVTKTFDAVFVVYCVDLVLAIVDLIVFCINKHREDKQHD